VSGVAGEGHNSTDDRKEIFASVTETERRKTCTQGEVEAGLQHLNLELSALEVSSMSFAAVPEWATAGPSIAYNDCPGVL
jgi:hypothetical protein